MKYYGIVVCCILGISGACGGEDEHNHAETVLSGAECPENSTLTYANFGQSFMSQYCTDCHSSTKSGNARQGAPVDHDFDTLDNIRATEAEHLDETAAAGSDHVHTAMPPESYGAQPTESERRQLGEWIACGFRE